MCVYIYIQEIYMYICIGYVLYWGILGYMVYWGISYIGVQQKSSE